MIKITIKENNKNIPKINTDYILNIVKTFINTKYIKGIYHYGSSYTGVYGKSHKDTYGDIDIAIVSKVPVDEDSWFNSDEYEQLKNQEYDTIIVTDEKEIPGPFKQIK